MLLNNTNYQKRIIYICVNIQTVIAIVGIISNILAIRVFNRKALKKHSYSFYCRVVACSDILILLHSFRHWANFVLDINIDLISPLICQFTEYQPHVATIVSLWLLAVISIDRLITIVYHQHSRLLKSRWFQVSMVSIVLIYSILLNSQIPLNTRLLRISNDTLICFCPSSIQYRVSYTFIINILLPNLLINNLVHLRLILFIRASRKKAHGHLVRRRFSTIRDRKFAITSIMLNVASSLVKIPFGLGLFASNYFNLPYEQYQLIFVITVTLTILDNCDLLYVNLMFNSLFCSEFFKMIRHLK